MAAADRSAGYLGAALFGAALIRLGRSARWRRAALTVVGAALLLLSLRYGIPTSSQRSGSAPSSAVVAGTLLGVAFLLVARRATPGWTLFLTNLLAIQAGLTAFWIFCASSTFRRASSPKRATTPNRWRK